MANQNLKTTKKVGSSLCLLVCVAAVVELTGGCAMASNGRRGWLLYHNVQPTTSEQMKAEREKQAELEKAEREKQAELEKAEREKAEQERLDREKAERERVEREKAEREKAEQEKAKIAKMKSAGSSSSDDGSSFWDVVLWYLPNRVCDFVDLFTIEIGGGANACLDLHLTHACGLGAGCGNEYMIGWDRRFFGGEKCSGLQFDSVGYKAVILYLGAEKHGYDNIFGNFPKYYYANRCGVIDINAPEYNRKRRDFWAIGVEVGLLFNAKLEIHPLALVDFITGLVLIDIEKDDYSPKDDKY